jgi:glucose/arabinose dehydrogenase
MPSSRHFVRRVVWNRAFSSALGAVAAAVACSNSPSTPDGNEAGAGSGGAGTANAGATSAGKSSGGGGAAAGTPSGGAGSGGTNGGASSGSAGAAAGTPSGGAGNGGASGGAAGSGGANGGASSGSGGAAAGTPSGGAGSGGTGNVTCDASAAPDIGQLGIETVVQSNDLDVMVYAAQPPGSSDWYLVDALGFVRVYSNGALQATPFLDVSSEIQGSGFTGNGAPTGGSQNYDERGLLSIAFPPDYADSGKFYVTLIPTSGDATDHDLVLEYTRSAANPLVADPSTRKALIDLEPGGEGYVPGMAFSYAKYHNGSTVLFGPDGMLYVGMGDGGGDCNAARPGTPQDVASPYGKILRLDPKAPAPYAAAGNPFADGGDARVYHYGFRNPFRFSFDALTHDLYVGEVGQWTNDWLVYAPAAEKGLNFGWPAFEGVTENPTGQCASNTDLRSGSTRTNPIFNLAHGSEGGVSNLIVAIVGGAVYRGSAIPALQGAYLFAEFYPNRPMRALYQCGTQTSEVTVIQKRCDPNTPDAPCFVPVGGAPQLSQVGSIVQGNDGELYIPANGNTLLKIVPAP